MINYLVLKEVLLDQILQHKQLKNHREISSMTMYCVVVFVVIVVEGFVEVVLVVVYLPSSKFVLSKKRKCCLGSMFVDYLGPVIQKFTVFNNFFFLYFAGGGGAAAAGSSIA